MCQHANILIIEDEAVLAMDLDEQLTAYGYCVVGTARTGRNALSLFQTYRVDLVLCDIGLTGEWDGIRAVTELTHWRPVPVIYLTGHTDRDLLVRAQATRPVTCLLKPWESSLLHRMIETALACNSPRQLGIPLQPPKPQSPERFDGERQPDGLVSRKTFVSETASGSPSNSFRHPGFHEVLYLKAGATTTTVITAGQPYIIPGSLPLVLRQMANHRLIRTHRTFAVNLDQVHSFSEWEVRVGTHALPLGRVHRDAFLAHFPPADKRPLLYPYFIVCRPIKRYCLTLSMASQPVFCR